jgi:hypothetical protein
VKSKPLPEPTGQSKPKATGNYIDTFVKQMFSRVLVFVDFLVNYADKKFVSQIDLMKIQPAPTHYIGQKGDERIVDLVFQCPLRNGDGSLMAVIIFEHQNTSLKAIPEKLLRYISAIWDAERKEGKKVLSAPYFLVLRTGKTPFRGRVYPTMSDSLPKDVDGKPIGKTVEIEYDVVDLPACDFDKLAGGAVLRSSLMMLHTTTEGNLDDFPKALQPLLELPEGERVEVTKEMLDFVAKAFAAKNRRLEASAASAAVETIFKGKEKAMIKTIFEEREAIGEARGEANRGRSMVLTALRTKFKRVPKDIEKTILSMSDPIALESLLAQAIQSETMDEFAESLR